VAEVDLSALRGNADVLRARLGPGVGILAVVKADAYGHGAVVCARALERRVWGFGVSLVEEGVEIRRAGVEAPILVLGAAYGLEHRDVLAYRLTPVLGAASDLARFRHAADELGIDRVDVHLKIDTGMARLGLRPGPELEQFCDALAATPGIALSGLMTHFACADDADESISRTQLARFEDARAALRLRGHDPTLLHVANSAGLVRFPESRHGLVRPGLALYGLSPSPTVMIPGLRPVLSLRSRVVALREITTGEPVSYGGLFLAARPTRVATVPVGYADGYTRRLTGKAEVLVKGRRCKVIGAITMDMCLVDVTDLEAPSLGDEVVLLGAQGGERITAEELAEQSGTISWEILTGIGKRVPRYYAGERP
jgi:alanine racemase